MEAIYTKPDNLTELVLMIYKTHTGEWITATKARAIASDITGVEIQLADINRSLNRLTRQCKLTRSKTSSAWMVFEG